LPILECVRNLGAMRRLFLVRHAKAELSVGRDDYARKLTERGRADARRVAKTLAARRFLPDLLIHSGAARAIETAEIFAAEWRGKVALEKDGRLYDASFETLLDRTRELRDEHKHVGLVGHNPGFGELAAALAGSGTKPDLQRLGAKYPTGAVAVLDFSIERWDEVEPNSGTLALYLTPGELEAGPE
jgi:phosphohistidine phosphatase